MACDVIINFSGNKDKPLVLEQFVSFSESPLMELAKALYNDSDSVESIIDNMKKIYATDSDRLQSKNNIGNISIRQLINSIPVSQGWPDISEVEEALGNIDDYNIVYTEDNEGGGFPDSGFFIKTVGKEKVKFLKISRNNLGKFRNWLLSKILASKIDNDTEFSKDFNQLLEHYGITGKELISSYLDGKDYSQAITIKDKKIDVESIISDEIYRLQGLIQKRIYKNEFFNSISRKIIKKVIHLSLKQTMIFSSRN